MISQASIQPSVLVVKNRDGLVGDQHPSVSIYLQTYMEYQ